MFITFEGIEGSGKTTQIEYLAEYLSRRGFPCVKTREPGGTAIRQKIRAILLDPEHRDLDPRSELLLYIADRVQHVQTLIRPALAEGRVVLCDRYLDATVAYQGYARGLQVDFIYQFHEMLSSRLTPTATFLLDLPPEVGLARAWRQLEDGSRAEGERRFEEETLAFHQLVRAGYLELAHREPRRIHIVDAEQAEKKVRRDIEQIVAEML
jgi:dTMP kinase